MAYDDGFTAVQALMNGQVDCVVIDNAPAQEFVKNNAGLTILDTEYAVEDYAIGLNKGNTACLLYTSDMERILLTEADIQARVEELGRQISRDFAGREPIFVGVLKGCFIFMADLLRSVELHLSLIHI